MNSHEHNLILKALSAIYMMAVEFPQCAITTSVATLSTRLGVVVELQPHYRINVTGTPAEFDFQAK